MLVSTSAAAQSWTSSPLNIARNGHGAAALPGGDVLVVGGYTDMTTWTARAVERYIASTGSWYLSGETQGDHFADAVLLPLPDGRLVAASMDDNLETYDPATDTWTEQSGYFFLTESAVTQLADGDPFFVGGGMDFNDWSTVARFDADTDTLQGVAPLALARRRHTATLLADGRVLVTGGFSSSLEEEFGEELASTEIYDPATDTWSAGAPLPETRQNHRAALLPDGRVLVTGGHGKSSTVIYDPSTSAWAAGPAMAGVRQNHTMTTLPSGRIVVIGGAGALTSVELFDPATEAFVALPSMPVGHAGHTTTYLPGEGLLVVGGSSAEFYALHGAGEGEACVISEECASGTCEGGLCEDDSGSSGAGAGGPWEPPGGGGCSLPFFGLGASSSGAAGLLFVPGLFARRRKRSRAGQGPQR